MQASFLIAASAGLAAAMGAGHLILGLFTNVFAPRDADLWERMKTASPRFSSRLKMWRSLVGFHGSHSYGPIIFGVIYGYLALIHPDFLFQSLFLVAFGAAVLLAYIVLAVLYWFYLPLLGLCIALACYVAGVALAYAH